MAGIMTLLKKHLDRFMDNKGLEGYDQTQAAGTSRDGVSWVRVGPNGLCLGCVSEGRAG